MKNVKWAILLHSVCLIFVASASANSILPVTTQYSLTGIESQIEPPYIFSGTGNNPPGVRFVLTLNQSTCCSVIGVGASNFSLYNGTSSVSAAITSFTFNSSTDLLTGTFTGSELVWPSGFDGNCAGNASCSYKWFLYSISGTFSETINTTAYLGTGSVNITNSTFLYAGGVPEPGSFVMLGTGLCGIIASVRRRAAHRFVS